MLPGFFPIEKIRPDLRSRLFHFPEPGQKLPRLSFFRIVFRRPVGDVRPEFPGIGFKIQRQDGTAGEVDDHMRPDLGQGRRVFHARVTEVGHPEMIVIDGMIDSIIPRQRTCPGPARRCAGGRRRGRCRSRSDRPGPLLFCRRRSDDPGLPDFVDGPFLDGIFDLLQGLVNERDEAGDPLDVEIPSRRGAVDVDIGDQVLSSTAPCFLLPIPSNR